MLSPLLCFLMHAPHLLGSPSFPLPSTSSPSPPSLSFCQPVDHSKQEPTRELQEPARKRHELMLSLLLCFLMHAPHLLGSPSLAHPLHPLSFPFPSCPFVTLSVIPNRNLQGSYRNRQESYTNLCSHLCDVFLCMHLICWDPLPSPSPPPPLLPLPSLSFCYPFDYSKQEPTRELQEPRRKLHELMLSPLLCFLMRAPHLLGSPSLAHPLPPPLLPLPFLSLCHLVGYPKQEPTRE